MDVAVIIIFFLLFLGSLIYFISSVFYLFRIKSSLISKKEFKKEAQKQVSKLKIKDPVINCEYCGCKIDTKKEKICPGCGGSYENNEKWLKRHDVSDTYININSSKIANAKIKQNDGLSREALQRIICSGLSTIFFLFLLIVSIKTELYYDNFRKNEDLNEKDSVVKFSVADYSLDGDGIIYEDENITVKILGFYTSDRDRTDDILGSSGTVKIGFKVSNRTGENLGLSLQCQSVDGITREWSCFNFNNVFKKNSDVVFYERVSDIPEQTISELTISECDVIYGDREKNTSLEKPVTIKTTADPVQSIKFEDYDLVFSNEKIDIYRYDKTSPLYTKSYILYKNKTDMNVSINCDGMTADGATIGRPIYYYDIDIAPQNVFISDYGNFFDKAVNDTDGKKIQASFTFFFKDDPSLSFSTGYIDIP